MPIYFATKTGKILILSKSDNFFNEFYLCSSGFPLEVCADKLSPFRESRSAPMPVSYTHLTLPTILRV